MVTLLVVGIILAIATPNFRQFVLNSRMTGSANDLLASIQLARSEAIKRQQPVAVCGSANPQAVLPACANQFTGWAVWVDTNNDAVINGGEAVLSAHEPIDPGLNLISNGTGFVSYGPDGFSRIDIGGNPATTLVLMCDERGNRQVGDSYRKRALLLSQTGRPAVLKRQDEFAPLGAAVNCPEA